MGVDLDSIRLVQAKWYSPGRTSPITMIVLHDMEAGEFSTTAENCANYFRTTTNKASAHYCVDNDSIVCSVKPTDTAFHTGQGTTNRCSIGIEQAGYASQTPGEWNDEFSRAMIYGQTVPLTQALCDRYGIPKVFLTAADLRAGKTYGITTHWEISKAFVPGGHSDPGPNFPIDEFMGAVKGGNTPASGNDDGAAAVMRKKKAKMFDSLLDKRLGTIVEVKAQGNGKLAIRWQVGPNGMFTVWQPLGNAPGVEITYPGSFDSVALSQNQDGRFEIMAWHSYYGSLFRITQDKVGGYWRQPYQAD